MDSLRQHLHFPHRSHRDEQQERLHEVLEALNHAQKALASYAATAAKDAGHSVYSSSKEKLHETVPSYENVKHGFGEAVDSVKGGFGEVAGGIGDAFSSKPQSSCPSPESLAYLVAAIAAPVLLSYFVSQMSKRNVKTWYRTLKKPWWQPPSWVFPPLYSSFFVLMGLASWMVAHYGGGIMQQKTPLTWYGATLLLSLLWPLNFFGGHRLGLALLNSLAALFAAAGTVTAFSRVNATAGYLVWPYAIWLAYATVLNLKIVQDNKYGSRIGRTPAQEEISRQNVSNHAAGSHKGD
jgi:benzodiazapine receptor